MNAISTKLTGDFEIDFNLYQFYSLRSSILDQFADIEQAIINFIAANAPPNLCATVPLGQKIEKAKSIKAGRRRSKELKAKVDSKLDEVLQFLPIRASIVHSRMNIAVNNNQQFLALFPNAKNQDDLKPEALVYNAIQLQKLEQKLTTLAKAVSWALSQENQTKLTVPTLSISEG